MWSIVTVIDGKLTVLHMTDACIVYTYGGSSESSRRSNALPILDGSNPIDNNVRTKLCEKSKRNKKL